MEETFTLQQKIKVIKKLKEIGCRSEKELYEVSLAQILNIPNITVPEITLILQLQKHTKTNKLFSFLVNDKEIVTENHNQNKKSFK